MRIEKYLKEASYAGNLGFEELVRFYGEATKSQISQLEQILDAEDWEGFKNIIKKVLGVSLK